MSTVGSEQILYTIDAGVCTITFSNPKRRNAWNPDMEQQYWDALDRAAADPDVRAIVVTGAGSSFCPGLDSQRLEQAAGEPDLRKWHGLHGIIGSWQAERDEAQQGGGSEFHGSSGWLGGEKVSTNPNGGWGAGGLKGGPPGENSGGRVLWRC